MSKEDSLKFLEEYIENIKNATPEEIEKWKKIYDENTKKKQIQEQIEITPAKEVVLTFGGGLLQEEPIANLTNEELDQVIQIAEKIKKERNK